MLLDAWSTVNVLVVLTPNGLYLQTTGSFARFERQILKMIISFGFFLLYTGIFGLSRNNFIGLQLLQKYLAQCIHLRRTSHLKSWNRISKLITRKKSKMEMFSQGILNMGSFQIIVLLFSCSTIWKRITTNYYSEILR